MSDTDAAPYGGARSFGRRFVERALAKLASGVPLNDRDRHAIEWAADVEAGQSAWRVMGRQERRAAQRETGARMGRRARFVDPAALARHRRRSALRTPARPLRGSCRAAVAIRAREGHGRPRSANAPPSASSDDPPGDDDAAALAARLEHQVVELGKRLELVAQAAAAAFDYADEARSYALDALDLAGDG